MPLRPLSSDGLPAPDSRAARPGEVIRMRTGVTLGAAMLCGAGVASLAGAASVPPAHSVLVEGSGRLGHYAGHADFPAAGRYGSVFVNQGGQSWCAVAATAALMRLDGVRASVPVLAAAMWQRSGAFTPRRAQEFLPGEMRLRISGGRTPSELRVMADRGRPFEVWVYYNMLPWEADLPPGNPQAYRSGHALLVLGENTHGRAILWDPQPVSRRWAGGGFKSLSFARLSSVTYVVLTITSRQEVTS